MLRALMEKVGNMQKQMDNISREMEILRMKNYRDQKHCSGNEEYLFFKEGLGGGAEVGRDS